jgi:hypothetical protein
LCPPNEIRGYSTVVSAALPFGAFIGKRRFAVDGDAADREFRPPKPERGRYIRSSIRNRNEIPVSEKPLKR